MNSVVMGISLIAPLSSVSVLQTHGQYHIEEVVLAVRGHQDGRGHPAVPKQNPIAVTVESKALMESIDRVSVVISDKLKSPVRCRFPVWTGRLSLVETAKATSSIIARRTFRWMETAYEKALLQNAISVTSRAVAQKSSIPALEGLLLVPGAPPGGSRPRRP
mgnify:CR=1 FL=1